MCGHTDQAPKALRLRLNIKYRHDPNELSIPFDLTTDTELGALRSYADTPADAQYGPCQNSHAFKAVEPDLVEKLDLDGEASCVGEQFLRHASLQALRSRITTCANVECRKLWAAHDSSAPRCEWTAFRNHVLTVVSCGLHPTHLQDLSANAEIHWEHNESHWKDEAGVYSHPCVDIKGALEVVFWAENLVQGHRYFHFRASGVTQDVLNMLRPGEDADALRQTEACQAHGVCPARLWNISFLSLRGVTDITPVAELARDAPGPRSKDLHEDCTTQQCMQADLNSAVVQQAHKGCGSGQCAELRFPPESLNEALRQSKWRKNAWKLAESPSASRPFRVCDEETQYMAISHVWSDGTGVGTKPVGHVNQCLYSYFAAIARSQDCDGIWWDTICIPTEREIRKSAIRNMLQNYEAARVTVVHDEDLVNFEWRDEGTPAVALVLSSWFSRGWTAAELWASRRHPVKVLFADPDAPDGPPLAKDLDDDVLSHDYGATMLSTTETYASQRTRFLGASKRRVPKLGHLVASEIVRQLRPKIDDDHWLRKTQNLGDLLRILRRRTTSWRSDRLKIAVLMSRRGGEIDPEWTGPHITKNLLGTYEHLATDMLLHGEVCIETQGPWDWCPPSIFDLGRLIFAPHDDRGENPVWVSADGQATGFLRAFPLLQKDFVVPVGRHPSLAARVSLAKSDWSRCLLLANNMMLRHHLFVLFQPATVMSTQFGTTLGGYWIACVTSQEIANEALAGLRRSINDYSLNVCFGSVPAVGGRRMPLLSFDATNTLMKSMPATSRMHPRGRRRCLAARDWDGNYQDPDTKWLPQPIWIHMTNNGTGEQTQPTLPHAIAALDFQHDDRASYIEASFLQRLAPRTEIGDETEIDLLWSFESRSPFGVESPCRSRRESRFWTTFRVVKDHPSGPSFGKEHQIRLGAEAIETHIAPRLLQLYEAIGTWMPEYQRCEKCEECRRAWWY